MHFTQSDIQALLTFFGTVVEIYKQHELLVVAIASSIGGVRLGVWAHAIAAKNVADDAQRRHDEDQALIAQANAERDTANARLGQMLKVMGEWSEVSIIAVSRKPRNYVEEISAPAILEGFPTAGEGHSKHSRTGRRLSIFNRRQMK